MVLGLGGYERYAIFIGHPIAKLGTTTRLLRVFEEPLGGKEGRRRENKPVTVAMCRTNKIPYPISNIQEENPSGKYGDKTGINRLRGELFSVHEKFFLGSPKQ